MTYDRTDAVDLAALERWSACFAALAHPVRLRIVSGLLDGGCCVGPMVECLGLPQALVSRHLAVLRSAGILSSVVEGRRRVYRVTDPRVASLVQSIVQPHDFNGGTR